jgi:hypothetical protein
VKTAFCPEVEIEHKRETTERYEHLNGNIVDLKDQQALGKQLYVSTLSESTSPLQRFAAIEKLLEAFSTIVAKKTRQITGKRQICARSSAEKK